MLAYIPVHRQLVKLYVPDGGYDVTMFIYQDASDILNHLSINDDNYIHRIARLIVILCRYNLVRSDQAAVINNVAVSALLNNTDYLDKYVAVVSDLYNSLHVIASLHMLGWLNIGCIEPNYSTDYILSRRQIIYDKVISKYGSYNITESSLRVMVRLYKKMFIPSFTEEIKYKLNTKCTSTAGKHKIVNTTHIVELCPNVITIYEPCIVNGINVSNPIQAAQIVLEHELVHCMVPCVKHSSIFKKKALSYFGHTDVKHSLGVSKTDTSVGDMVMFRLKGTHVTGTVIKVNRKTVCVQLLSDETEQYDVSIGSVKCLS